MAAHAVKAGEGDAFIAAGVEAVSRYVHGNADGHPGTENPRFAAAQARSREIADGVLDWSDPRADGELPDIYVAMGHTAENVAALERVSGPSRTRTPCAARTGPRKASLTASGDATSPR
jgi:acetyl-CoA C-acetyltransferase